MKTDAIAIELGIAEKDRKEISESLSKLLADTYVLYVKTQKFHWNVTGVTFYALHKLFAEQYQALAVSVDLIAERIRALGAFAPGSFEEFSELAQVAEFGRHEPPSGEEMIRILLHDHETLSQKTRQYFESAEKAKDQGTADLLSERMLEHEKAAWMLRSLGAEEWKTH
jgi:starvation-inducible DNA-binding protein